MKPRITVCGFPRSGTTWLCRLIANAWNCPIGTIHSPDIFHGHPAEGKGRSGPFVVLHGHDPPNRIEKKEGDFCFFIHRDPRDVIVSIHHYFNRPLDECIDNAINGRLGVKGPLRFPIDEYVKKWLRSDVYDYAVRYEMLHADVAMILCDIGEILNVEPVNDLKDVIRRQSFLNRRDAPSPDREYHLRHMRKGIIGDWQNHFTVEQLAKVQHNIDGLGYW